MADREIRRLQLVEVCAFLRTKSVFIPGNEDQAALVEPSDTAVYWCNRTGRSVGPDHAAAAPKECAIHRDCYLASQIMRSRATGSC